MDIPPFPRSAVRGAERVSGAWRYVNAQPGWVTRLALLTVVFVIAIPLLTLLFLAVAAGTLVFGALAIVNRLKDGLRGALPRKDGRENVVVRRRIE